MPNLVSTDFNQQGINALNTGMGIGNQMRKGRALEQQQRMAQQKQQQQTNLYGQKSQLNEQSMQMNNLSIQQKERLQAQAEMISAIGVQDVEKRNEIFKDLEEKTEHKSAKEFYSGLQKMDDAGQVGAVITFLRRASGDLDEQDGKGGNAAKIGTVSPKDFTTESMAAYQKSGDIKDLNRYSPKTVTVAGVAHSLNPENQKWEPIVDATSEQLTEQAKAIAILEADKKSRIDFAKSKTKWQTGRPKFKSKIASSKASQKILEATSQQIKDNINIWSTKYGASLSSLPGTEARRLKGQLNTLKAHSAFSTLTDLKDSGGTLGAISEAELVLLESKLGALDQGGDATELVRVIDQIVNSNISSIGRLETEFYNTNAMYNSSFDELEAASNQPAAPRAQALPNAVSQGAPQVGQVVDGWIFKGGDPSKPESWEQQ